MIRTGYISYGLACLCAVSILAIACSGDTPTSPSDSTATTTTATTIAEPSVTEDFSGTLAVAGSSFYSFTVGANGTVNVTLAAISGTGVPSGVWVELGVGSPAGEGCAVTSTVNGPAGASPQLSTVYAPGVYCVRIRDLGNLFAPARFAIAIAHP